MIAQSRAALSVAISLLLVAGSAQAGRAQQSDSTVPTALPINENFLTGSYGWAALGDNAKVSMADSTVNLTPGRGALRLDYSIAKDQFAAFGFPLNRPLLADAKSFRFRILSDHATTIAFGMQEYNGGRYVAFFTVPKNEWQSVELSPADFKLSSGPNDPKDSNNKLDLDKIQFVGLTDAAQSSPMMDDATVSALFAIEPGDHSLYVSSFQISASALSASGPGGAAGDVVDDFSHPQVDWITFGGVTATTYSRAAQGGRGLRAAYKQSPGKVAGILKMLGYRELAGASKLVLAIASEKAASLVVRVEQGDGRKFDAKASIPAGTSAAKVLSFAFNDFALAEGSKDMTAKLDIDKAVHIQIIDATGLAGGVAKDVPNTLYVGALRVER